MILTENCIVAARGHAPNNHIRLYRNKNIPISFYIIPTLFRFCYQMLYCMSIYIVDSTRIL